MYSLDLLLKQIDDPSELSWKDETYDLALARDLEGTERDALVLRLIEAARADDQRAVLTLGYIGAVETLPAVLYLAKAKTPMAATARRVVVMFGKGDEVIDEIVRDALHASAKMERVAAILDLPKVGGAKAIDALEQALGDADYQVRELAWDGLVTALDLDRALRSPEGKRELFTSVELISVFLGSGLTAFQRMGREEMHELIGKLQGGATPESLGIAWSRNPAPEVFQATRVALFDAEAKFPVDAIKQLDGIGRRWAETMIALRLEHQDERVPEALARLDAEWTVPVLEEVAQLAGTPPSLREQIASSIATMRAS
jgi:hypothetical protein